jgi:hypothetical protein
MYFHDIFVGSVVAKFFLGAIALRWAGSEGKL